MPVRCPSDLLLAPVSPHPSKPQGLTLVKDVVKCFMCSVKGIEKTFNTYQEFQDHLYKDHDMHKDPAMEIYNKYRTSDAKANT